LPAHHIERRCETEPLDGLDGGKVPVVTTANAAPMEPTLAADQIGHNRHDGGLAGAAGRTAEGPALGRPLDVQIGLSRRQ
jgi:hypothetical protein